LGLAAATFVIVVAGMKAAQPILVPFLISVIIAVLMTVKIALESHEDTRWIAILLSPAPD
jgi:predicted PurR-regulated permease PerM